MQFVMLAYGVVGVLVWGYAAMLLVQLRRGARGEAGGPPGHGTA